MGVRPEDIRHIATLAALRLSDDEVDRLTDDLNEILDHVDALREADTTAVPPFGAADRAPLRPDEPGADRLEEAPGDAAPGWEAGFFTVPRLASHAPEAGRPDGAPPSGDGTDEAP